MAQHPVPNSTSHWAKSPEVADSFYPRSPAVQLCSPVTITLGGAWTCWHCSQRKAYLRHFCSHLNLDNKKGAGLWRCVLWKAVSLTPLYSKGRRYREKRFCASQRRVLYRWQKFIVQPVLYGGVSGDIKGTRNQQPSVPAKILRVYNVCELPM